MWNYRICKKTYRTGGTEANPTESTCVSYEIHEAYYNENGGIWAVTEEPVTLGAYIDLGDETEAEKIAELHKTLDWMRLALAKGVIDLDTYVFAEQDPADEETLKELDEILAGDEFIELNIEEDSEDK
jgi:hypothetical protein